MVTGSNPVRRTIYGDLIIKNQKIYDGGCSSVGRAPDCDSGCRGFESRHSPHFINSRQHDRSMAQPGSASGLGPEGRRFESYCSDHFKFNHIKVKTKSALAVFFCLKFNKTKTKTKTKTLPWLFYPFNPAQHFYIQIFKVGKLMTP